LKKIWVQKATSFREAARFDRQYYQALSPNERIEIVDRLRSMVRKFRKGRNGGTRLRKVIRVVHVKKLRPRKTLQKT